MWNRFLSKTVRLFVFTSLISGVHLIAYGASNEFGKWPGSSRTYYVNEYVWNWANWKAYYARQAWNNITPSPFNIYYGGTTGINKTALDGMSVIHVKTFIAPDGIPPARTSVWWNSRQDLIDADIEIQGRPLVISWFLIGRLDLQGILTHEFGHVLGFGHSSNYWDTMYWRIGPERNYNHFARTLELEDKRGMNEAYP